MGWGIPLRAGAAFITLGLLLFWGAGLSWEPGSVRKPGKNSKSLYLQGFGGFLLAR